MTLSVEIFVIYLISILVTQLNATTDTSMQFFKCRTSQGGFKWYTLSAQILKAQIFLILHIFLAVAYIMQGERVFYSVYDRCGFFERKII